MNAAHLLTHFDHIADAPDAIPRLRRFILDLAVRGKLVEQDPNDEPAAELLRHRKIAKYLRNINVRWFDFDLSDLLEMRFEDSELPEFALRCGDVLICEEGEPGRAAVWDGRETDIYFQKAIHRVRLLDFVDSEFFVKALRASADDGRLAEYFTGTGIKHFTGKGLAAYLFPLPPLAEQRRIVAKVKELMALCGRLEVSLATGDNMRRWLVNALLHKAVSAGATAKDDGSDNNVQTRELEMS